MNAAMPKSLANISQNLFSTTPSRIFASPAPSGRQIVCSFSYIQRIGRRAAIDVWFPSELHRTIAHRLQAGDKTILTELGVEWAAIREFALVKESDYEEDFNPERLLKAVRDKTKWRGQDGYRITVVMLGNYGHAGNHDELQIHDERLQKEMTNLIHMLYMEKESHTASDECNRAIRLDDWKCGKILPHVTLHLGTMDTTGRGAPSSRQCATTVDKILNLVDTLPKSHIVHDVAIGLVLPDLESKNHNNRLLESWEKFSAFAQLMDTFFDAMGHTSMSALHGMGDAPQSDFASKQMPGFGAMRAANDSSTMTRFEMFTHS